MDVSHDSVSSPELASRPARTSTCTKADFERVFERVKNWGRWGKEDVLGTLNYITPERIAAAAHLIRNGRAVSLSLPVNKIAGPDNPRPALHFMRQLHGSGGGTTMAADFVGVDIHGESQSHIDALCHAGYGGLLYNGQSVDGVTPAGGGALDVANYAGRGVVGRGVLLDVAGFRGVPWLEPGEAVGSNELEAIEQAVGLRVGEGDILVFRTGHDRRRRALGPWDSSADGIGKAGLDLDAVVWLHVRRVAAFLPDGDGETMPCPVQGVRAPVHALQIAAMGMAAADSLDLEPLADACQKEGRFEFFIVVAPLSLPGGTGSLVNPIAIF
jgi:kynurenine formamidase